MLDSSQIKGCDFCRETTAMLTAGRHPLTERVVELFVPNDTVMSRASDRLQANPDSMPCYATVIGLRPKIFASMSVADACFDTGPAAVSGGDGPELLRQELLCEAGGPHRLHGAHRILCARRKGVSGGSAVSILQPLQSVLT